MIVVLGFAMIAVFMYLILSKRTAPVIALILVPAVFAVIAVALGVATVGDGGVAGAIMEAIKSFAPTAALLFFAIIYFGLMIDVGLFDPLIRVILRMVGNSPVRLVVGTVVLAGLVSLDGDGSTTFIITVSALLPVYVKLGLSPVVLTTVANVATVVTLSVGNAVALGDPALVSSNISIVRRGLNMSLSTASLVTAASFLAVAAALLAAGVLGDNYGFKRMFIAGAAGAAVFGLIGAAAPNAGVLVAARVGAGVSFAFLLCLPLAIINAAFPPGRISGAIALYVGLTSALAVAPPILGSMLVQAVGWRSGLLVTPVLALVLVVLAVRFVPETPQARRAPDWLGVLLAAVAQVDSPRPSRNPPA